MGLRNTIVMDNLKNSMELEINESIICMEITHEIWKELQDKYHQGDIFRVSDLQENIYLLK